MGLKFSTGNVTSGVKEQATGATRELYQYMDLKGGGELVELMKAAKKSKNKDYSKVDAKIRDELKRFLYNDGRGKWIHVREQVMARYKDNGMQVSKKAMQPSDEEVQYLEKLSKLGDDVPFLSAGKYPSIHPITVAHCRGG